MTILEQELEKIIDEICHKKYGYKMFPQEIIKAFAKAIAQKLEIRIKQDENPKSPSK